MFSGARAEVVIDTMDGTTAGRREKQGVTDQLPEKTELNLRVEQQYQRRQTIHEQVSTREYLAKTGSIHPDAVVFGLHHLVGTGRTWYE